MKYRVVVYDDETIDDDIILEDFFDSTDDEIIETLANYGYLKTDDIENVFLTIFDDIIEVSVMDEKGRELQLMHLEYIGDPYTTHNNFYDMDDIFDMEDE